MFELGNSLREARIRSGLDFTELEQATKVRPKYLRALEDEQFDVLPSQTYVRGFLRTYAEVLGLDGQLFVDEYNSRFAAGERIAERIVQPRRSRVRPRREPRLERNAVVIAVVAIGVVTALVIAAWRFGGGSEPSGEQTQGSQEPAVESLPTKATLVVRAVRGESLLIVRRGYASGEVLYNGTVKPNHPKRFAGKRLWLNLSSPTNLELVLNGKRYSVGGAKPCVVVVTPLAIRPAAPDSC